MGTAAAACGCGSRVYQEERSLLLNGVTYSLSPGLVLLCLLILMAASGVRDVSRSSGRRFSSLDLTLVRTIQTGLKSGSF